MILSLLTTAAFAGERFHAWTYDASTLPKGAVELEHYATVETHHEDGELVAEWKHQAELEVGITPALEGALYIVAEQEGDAALTFSAYKARLRYRFWPIGTKAVDFAGYLEYVGSPTFEAHAVEAKIILSKESDKLRAALNVTGELEFEGAEMETVLEPTVGLAWRVTPRFAPGIEAKMETVFADEMEGPFLWAGPSVHLSGMGGKMFWTTSAIIGLTGPTRDDAEIEARSLIGIEL